MKNTKNTKNTKNNEKGRTRVAIIGAGLTGLWLSRELLKLGHTVDIFESSFEVGGRIKTVMQENTPLYDSGAWRVPLSDQTTVNLVLSLGLHLRKIPPPVIIHSTSLRCARASAGEQHSSTTLKPPSLNASDLSLRGVRIICEGVEAAAMANGKSGYHDQDLIAYGSSSYGVGDNNTTHEIDAGYAYIVEGFQALPRSLLAIIKNNPNLTVHLRRRVQFLRVMPEGKWRVAGTCRSVRGDTEIFNSGVNFDAVVCCVPPHALPRLVEANASPVLPDVFRPLRGAVSSTPLVHVYAPVPLGATGLPFFKITTQLPVSQCIGPAGPGLWWQPCYASGRDARFWNNLWLLDRAKFRAELRRQFVQAMHEAGLGSVAHKLLPSLQHVSVHFWEHAVHYWEPCWGLNTKNATRLAVHPSPVMHPSLFVAGEAVSLRQGWAAGCLSTAAVVVTHFSVSNPKYEITRRIPISGMFYNGIELHVPEAWLRHHPGGKSAIENHLLDGDISPLWEHMHHSRLSDRVLFSILANSIFFPKTIN